MVGTVEEGGLEIDHRVTLQHAGLGRLHHALFDGPEELPGHVVALDLLLELVAGAPRQGLDPEPDVTVLALAAGLAHEPALGLGGTGDRLPVGHLGLAHPRLNLELPDQPVADDVQVQLTHPGDDRLAGLAIHPDLEGRILLGKLGEGDADLVAVGPALGFDRHRDHRFGDGHLLQHDRVLLAAEGIAGTGILQAHQGHDLAGLGIFQVRTPVALHAQDPVDALPFFAQAVVGDGPGPQRAGVNPQVGYPPHIGVGGNLEDQAGEILFRGGNPLLFAVPVRVQTLDRRQVQRRRQVMADGVQQELHSAVAEGGTAEHRQDPAGKRLLAEHLANHLDRNRRLLQVEGHQLLVAFGQALQEFPAPLFGLVLHRLRHRPPDDLGARLVRVGNGLHLQQVDQTGKFFALADRQLDRIGIGAQAVADHGDRLEKIGAHPVHLVYVGDARHPVTVGLVPDGLRLGFHPAHGAEDADRAVQDPQGTLHLHGEINVSRGVDDGDLVVEPVEGNGGRSDGDTPFPLLGHPVGHGRTLVHVAQAVNLATVIEHPLGGGGLPGVDVGDDADIAQAGQLDVLLNYLGFSVLWRIFHGFQGPGFRRRPVSGV
ncbi:MAG: hypothetical protein BWY73_00939 [candidate division TA06 bacterium ADurb.Bin417]|uniref:Uncharacterized protein n=1 Tax=candidate division TA06 bacterium ADurb.Bin417 TaxID=1852828 RepID=A0A1V5MFN6_UNCT6|nr:MAG: hypothetical protein BWY73_00939 [candidate division TA06 bacterium ADurb.Bin417]